MEQQKPRSSTSLGVLSSDNLLRIFILLPPRSLARTCLVCTSWNEIIKSSALWQNIYREFRRCAKVVGKKDATNESSFQYAEIEMVVDWEAQFVKEWHRALMVSGSVMVKDWKGHSGRVECCRLQMGTIVTGSSDGIVRVWSTGTLQCLETYAVPNKAQVVELEYDENKILAVSGKELYIWRRERGRLLRRMGGHDQRIHCMCYADPEVFIGCADGTIRVFDMYSSQCTRIFRQHTECVNCVVLDVDSCLLASASADGTVQLCDSVFGKRIACLLPSSPPTGVNCLHLYQESSMLIGGTTAGQVYAWNMRKCMLVWNVRIGPNSVTSLHSQFYDTTTLVVGSINGIVTILDTESGMILNQYVPRRSADHTKWDRVLGTTLNMSPDGLMSVTVHEHVGDYQAFWEHIGHHLPRLVEEAGIKGVIKLKEGIRTS